MAMFLAIANRLIESGHIDREYLTAFTDAPSLVQPDGTFLKRDGKEQIYDLNTASVVDFDSAGAAPALEGTFTVDGVRLKTGFEMLKEHVKPLTPEWAATITGLPPTQIAQVATDMGEAAHIGSTTVVDGVTIPYRPVAIMAYHVAQQELGFQALRSAFIVEMLLGAIGAVGGQRTDFTWNIYKNFEPFGRLEETIEDGPYNIWLNHSKFYPMNSNNSSIAAAAMLDPDRWEVDVVPKVCLVHHANPAIAFPDSPIIQAAYMKFDFVAVVDPWLSETADLFGDVVLPAATIEKYEGPMSAGDQYVDAKAMRVPPIAPLYESRGEIDIYIDLCEKLGVLHGEGGYIDQLNKSLKLSDDQKLDLAAKPAVRDIFDRWSKDNGIEAGIAFFESGSAVQQKGELPPTKTYGYAVDPPFAGARHRLYGASLRATQDVMKAKGVDEIFWRLYTALPTWMTPTMENSPPEYDLILINHKKIEFKQARTNFVPLLNELAPEQRLEINPRSASDRGIDENDEVWIESHNAVTGERRKVRSKVSLLESVRPDTVSMPHHYGHFSNPITEGQGPSPNTLFFTGPGYVANTADQGYQVKVRVWKA